MSEVSPDEIFDKQKCESQPFRTRYDEKSRTWRGRRAVPPFSSHLCVGNVLLEALRQSPDRVAQISYNDAGESRATSNEDLRLNAIRVAQNLGTFGIQNGDVIGFVVHNQPDLAAVVLGCLSLGCIINAIDADHKSHAIASIFRTTQPTIVFCERDNYLTVRRALHALSWDVPRFTFGNRVPEDGDPTVDELLKETNAEGKFKPTDLVDGRNEMGTIVCSGGPFDDARTRDFCISHTSMLEQMSITFPITPTDITLSFSGLHTVAGLAMLIGGILRALTRIISTQPFDAKQMLRLVAKHRVTFYLSTPHELHHMVDHPTFDTTDLSSLTQFYVDRDVSMIAQHSVLIDRYLPSGVRRFYWKGEVMGVVAAGGNALTGTSVGQLAHGIHLQIRDNNERPCGPNVAGKIVLKIRPGFWGYLHQNELNEQFEKDGWIHTSDYGYLDEAGELYVADRKDGILTCYGHRVLTSEIEAVVMRTKNVDAVCVVGIPDKKATFLPAALVKRRKSGVTESQIEQHVKDHLDDYKQLRGGVFFVKNLPASKSGHILRDKSKDIVLNLSQKRTSRS